MQVHDDGVTNLSGGTPELVDPDWLDTLRREAMEENQVTVGYATYLGFQEVRQQGKAPYAQIRMVGLITAFHTRRPDPDGDGAIYRRYMAPLAEAAAMLDWGQPGEAQAEAAARTAATLWNLPVRQPCAAARFQD